MVCGVEVFQNFSGEANKVVDSFIVADDDHWAEYWVGDFPEEIGDETVNANVFGGRVII